MKIRFYFSIKKNLNSWLEISCNLPMQSFKNDKMLSKTSQESPKFSIFIFLPAAIMHLTSRCLVFLALNFTTASSFQMLSGANLIFTCLLSRLFLERKLEWWKWLAIFIIIGICINYFSRFF